MNTLNESFLSISRSLEDGDFDRIGQAIKDLDDLSIDDFVAGMQTLAHYAKERAGEAFLTFLEDYMDKKYGSRTEGIADLGPLLSQAFDYDGFPQELKAYLVSVD